MSDDVVALSFSHDIAGYQTVSLVSTIGITPAVTPEILLVPQPHVNNAVFGSAMFGSAVFGFIGDGREGPVASLTWTHGIAGCQTVSLGCELGVTPVQNDVPSLVLSPVASLGITPDLGKSFSLPRNFTAGFSISATFTALLNVGFTKIIQFGTLILRNANPTDWDEINLSCREAKIWDGTTAYAVDKVAGFQGKFRFYPIDYNDIYTLMGLIGTKQTLRIYGVPYRNCMIYGTIRKKQVKMGVSQWMVEVEIRQDTCVAGITI